MSSTTEYVIYTALITIIGYLIYQITFKDYTMPLEYFSADIPIRRTMPPLVLVNMKNYQFNPDFMQIPINTIVKWINLDSGENLNELPRVHAIVESHRRLFQSHDMFVNDTYSFKFDQPGTYYYNDPHNPKMAGMIIVTRETTV